MTQRYESEIQLTVLGPFLTAATGAGSYGLDKVFHRDYEGNLVLPQTHLKGKLRTALEELVDFFAEDHRPDINEWFGASSDQDLGNYEPDTGMLDFSNLRMDQPGQLSQLIARTRVTMNPKTLTAKENLLRAVEDPFPSGSQVLCKGTVAFYADDDADALRIARTLQTGLMWIPALGSEKGVGFGRLQSVSVSKPQPRQVAQTPQAMSGQPTLHLRIQPQEPILIGGIKSGRTNFVRSRREIPGSVVKGALVEALNRSHGIQPAHRPITADSAEQYGQFADLARHFHAVRVTHSFPATAGSERPVRKPISTVQGSFGEGDVALRSGDPYPLIQGQAPVYFVDWKEGDLYVGDAAPKEVFVTRSEIDDLSRRTADGRLFTYSFLCPVDDNDQAVEWVCNVDFSAIEDEAVRMAVKQQFADAVRNYLHNLGKLGRSVNVDVGDGTAQAAYASKQSVEGHAAIVTLQSDAIMLAAEAVGALQPGEDLADLYADYWSALSDGNLVLDDFFAHQTFEGGYLYHRYLGAAERTAAPYRYRPYYLTGAGSVFKLKVVNEEAARRLLDDWLTKGLPLPPWAQQEYGQYDRELWQNCPFVPENGYGEIAVNLAWHWDKQI